MRTLLACLLLTPALAVASDRPNILFFFTDDHAPHAIGAYSGFYKALDPTPTIDRLAADGIVFKNSFCTNSICGPSRAVIITGKHSHRNGFRNNGDNFDGDQQTFPKLLRKAGYQTALYGKWHLKSTPQGFDDWAVLPGQGEYYNPRMLRGGIDTHAAEGPKKRGEQFILDGYCTDVVTDMALDWLKDGRDADKPFLLMCQHKAPHRNWMPALRHLNLYDDVTVPEPDTLFDTEYADNAIGARIQEMEIGRHMHLYYDLFVTPESGPDADDTTKEAVDPMHFGGQKDKSFDRNWKRMTPEQQKTWTAAYGPENAEYHETKPTGDDLIRWKYQRYMKNYLRCVRAVDENMKRVLDALEEAGLAENTLVVYSSDQGFYLGDHGWYDKRWMYEESLKMPLVMRMPGVIEPGAVSEAMVQNLDYAPTFLELAGVDVPEDMQGRSLVPLFDGSTPNDWRKSLYYRFYEFPGVHMTAMHRGVRTRRYKLLDLYEFGEREFYDLQADPDELTNVIDDPKYAAEVQNLTDELERLRVHYGDDLPQERPEEWQRQYHK